MNIFANKNCKTIIIAVFFIKTFYLVFIDYNEFKNDLKMEYLIKPMVPLTFITPFTFTDKTPFMVALCAINVSATSVSLC